MLIHAMDVLCIEYSIAHPRVPHLFDLVNVPEAYSCHLGRIRDSSYFEKENVKTSCSKVVY